jgi:hypothetical protein
MGSGQRLMASLKVQLRCTAQVGLSPQDLRAWHLEIFFAIPSEAARPPVKKYAFLIIQTEGIVNRFESIHTTTLSAPLPYSAKARSDRSEKAKDGSSLNEAGKAEPFPDGVHGPARQQAIADGV